LLAELFINIKDMKTMATVAFSAALLLAVGSVFADPITGLFNTGVDGSGSPLPDGTVGDPHYSLIAVPSGTTTIRIRSESGGFPIPPWIEDNLISAWIAPDMINTVGSPGQYMYRTTFDLTGCDPSTAQITGRWSADNTGVQILINGDDTGNWPTSSDFRVFDTFSVMSGFIAGENTLDFVVNNSGVDLNPTGLRVEMTGSATVNITPDAGSSLALLGGAFAMLGALGRKFRK
jgi:hypothetical protein